MKKNLIKITAAAFAVTMAFTTTGIMASADEEGTATETPAVAEETPAEAPTEAPVSLHEETPTDAPAETPADAPAETPTDAPAETPTEVTTEAPTEEITVTTVTTEIAVISTETTATADPQVTTVTTAPVDTLLTSGSWRSNRGDYMFDASRPSGYFNGAHFTYEVSGGTVKFSLSDGTTLTGTLSIASSDNFSITWSNGSVETFSRQNTASTTTTATKSSSTKTSSTSTSKSSSSAPAGKTDSPKTGDDFHALPIAALAVTSAAVCFISFRKKEND